MTVISHTQYTTHVYIFIRNGFSWVHGNNIPGVKSIRNTLLLYRDKPHHRTPRFVKPLSPSPGQQAKSIEIWMRGRHMMDCREKMESGRRNNNKNTNEDWSRYKKCLLFIESFQLTNVSAEHYSHPSSTDGRRSSFSGSSRRHTKQRGPPEEMDGDRKRQCHCGSGRGRILRTTPFVTTAEKTKTIYLRELAVIIIIKQINKKNNQTASFKKKKWYNLFFKNS